MLRKLLARSSKWFIRVNVAMLVAASIGWPLTQFTVARHEPAFVLGLSWLAIWMTCLNNLLTAAVHDDTSPDV